MIHAGETEDIKWGSGVWVFLDIGFSNKRKSCGLLVEDGEPEELQFQTAAARISNIAGRASQAVNLVIEAPLSVAFDKWGNPSGRSFEKLGSKTRYWYNGLGCTVMVAAFYLVRAVHDARPGQDVRLFESFVSYKEQGTRSDHSRDVLLMRNVVKDPVTNARSIVAPDSLKMAADDHLISAFCVAGLDCGIPPVIKCDGR